MTPAPSNSSKAKAGASAPLSLIEHNQRLAKENRRLKEKLAHQAAFLRGRGFNPDALVTEADLANFSKWGEGFMKEAAKAERSAPKFGGQLTAAYDWLADIHHNPVCAVRSGVSRQLFACSAVTPAFLRPKPTGNRTDSRSTRSSICCASG